MALTETRPDTTEPAAAVESEPVARTQPTAVEKVLGTGDHKSIGRIFIGASLLFLVTDLVLTALVNFHIADGGDLIEATFANRLWLNHPIALMLCGVLPLLLGLAIYVVPLQVGAPTIAFPRAAAMSLWGWLGATVLFTVALIAKGSYGGSSEKLSRLGHVSFGLLMVSLLVGAVCVMATVISLRPAGMTVGDVPYFAFSMLVAGTLWLLTLPAALSIVTIWHIRRPTVSDLEVGAYPALEWLFHQPTVYIAAIPLLGIFADIASVATGRRQRNYAAVQALIGVFGFFAFGAWVQVPAARETFPAVLFAVAIVIAVLGVFGASLEPARRGGIKITPGFLLAICSILLLLLAGVAGAVQGIATTGKGQLFDVVVGGFGAPGPGASVGQFYLVIAAALAGGLAGLFHWGSRIFGGGVSSGAGFAAVPLMLIGGAAFGLGHVILGIATPDVDGVKILAGMSGAGALGAAAAALGGVAALTLAAVSTLRSDSGENTEAEDTSSAGTLEWLTASPPVAGNFADDLPAISSPYPLFDLNRVDTDDEGAE